MPKFEREGNPHLCPETRRSQRLRHIGAPSLDKRRRRERDNQTNTVPAARSAKGAEQVFVWFVEGAQSDLSHWCLRI